MNMIELLHILLEWIGFLLPWICIVSLAWIQSFFLTFLWSSNISLFLVLSIAHNFGSCPVSIICSLATPCALFLFLHPSCFGLWASLFSMLFWAFFFLGRGEVIFFNIGIHDQNLFSTWELDQHLRVNIITFQISFKFKVSFKRKSFDVNDPTHLENIIWIHSTLWIYFLPIKSLNLSYLELLPWRSKLNQLYYRRRKEFNLRN